MKTRRRAAFTLVEILVASALSSAAALIIYGVASEGLVAFARNTSINRSYSSARQALDLISVNMQSAGHTPLQIDSTGAAYSATTAAPNSAGIRFWRYGSTPLYYITTPTLTATSITVSLVKPGTTNTYLGSPDVGDIITISALGFQTQVTGVSNKTLTSVVLAFSGTVAANTVPTLTAAALAKATGQLSCLDWDSVAFIAVGTQLRYYPTFISGTTNVNTAANYQVIANLASVVGGSAAPLPFSLGPTPSINIDLYAETPDYNNRSSAATGGSTGTTNGYSGVNSAFSYTYMQTALSPRNPKILRTPF